LKTRNGFVSNSSSSSFIIGIGAIKDKAKFEKWKESIDLKWDGTFTTYSIQGDEYRSGNIKENQKDFYISAPINDECPEVSISKKHIEDNDIKEIVSVCIGNDEGDGCFYAGEDCYSGLDYDIDETWFDENQQRVLEEFGSKESGIEDIEITYGAGRNG
jgi:hypothetical protein